MKILLSRTDNLGDVMLTLPMAGWIKKHWPDSEIYFLGKAYTRPIIEASKHITGFVDKEALLKEPHLLRAMGIEAFIHVFPDSKLAYLAARERVPIRIGTSHRLQHWLSCNRLVDLGRKNSPLHEAQLNIKLIEPLGLPSELPLEEVHEYYGFESKQNLKQERFTVILHPKSKGSARDWPIANYIGLVALMPPDVRVIVTGTTQEGELIAQQTPSLFEMPQVENHTGKYNLTELIELIASAHALVACSTGPLHIGAALGLRTVGIYPAIKPMHTGRWGALGKNVKLLAMPNFCTDCKTDKKNNTKIICTCMSQISAYQVLEAIFKP
ncbi:MAG: glycosyltransferase family 9 protein [Cytophagales bacterium]|nr:MAG: glycosyltransferase family 9 protein [Cytophagales bacterium]TAF59882.1 MAG: glycosyltransferase family 9 protein [Cytophagales bacterium]